eukprot:24351-Pelagomonas_calceolata.AAC.3
MHAGLPTPFTYCPSPVCSEQPNPKRAAQKNLRTLEQHALDAKARRMDKIDLEALSGILACANGGHRVNEDEVLSIFVQPHGLSYPCPQIILPQWHAFRYSMPLSSNMASHAPSAVAYLLP